MADRADEQRPGMLATIGDISAGWLTDVLHTSSGLPLDDRVVELEAERFGTERGLLGEVHRVSFRCSSGRTGSVVVKVAATNELRCTADALGLYGREVAFYRRLAADVPLQTPRVHRAAISSTSTDFVLVLEDLKDLAPFDQVRGLTVDEAAAALGALAGLHAWGWGATSRLQDLTPTIPVLDSAITRNLYPDLFKAGWEAHLSHRPSPHPVLAAAADVWTASLPWLLSELGTPTTICHGDFRADNLFVGPDGSITTVDFQLVHLGCGLSDVAYLVSQSTEGFGRSDHVRLVRWYLDALEQAGVSYPFDAAWRQYRAGIIFHLVEAVVATLSWPSLEDRGRNLVLCLVERSGAAIDATDALDVIP